MCLLEGVCVSARLVHMCAFVCGSEFVWLCVGLCFCEFVCVCKFLCPCCVWVYIVRSFEMIRICVRGCVWVSICSLYGRSGFMCCVSMWDCVHLRFVCEFVCPWVSEFVWDCVHAYVSEICVCVCVCNLQTKEFFFLSANLLPHAFSVVSLWPLGFPGCGVENTKSHPRSPPGCVRGEVDAINRCVACQRKGVPFYPDTSSFPILGQE